MTLNRIPRATSQDDDVDAAIVLVFARMLISFPSRCDPTPTHFFLESPDSILRASFFLRDFFGSPIVRCPMRDSFRDSHSPDDIYFRPQSSSAGGGTKSPPPPRHPTPLILILPGVHGVMVSVLGILIDSVTLYPYCAYGVNQVSEKQLLSVSSHKLPKITQGIGFLGRIRNFHPNPNIVSLGLRHAD